MRVLVNGQLVFTCVSDIVRKEVDLSEGTFQCHALLKRSLDHLVFYYTKECVTALVIGLRAIIVNSDGFTISSKRIRAIVLNACPEEKIISLTLHKINRDRGFLLTKLYRLV